MSEAIARRTLGAVALSLAVLGSAAFQSDRAPSRPVLIVNATGQTITHFYASTPGFNVWEEDLLGDGVIPNGASARIDVNNGSGRCRYDFRARLADGSEPLRPDVEVCGIAEYRFTADEQEARADP